MFKHAFIDGLGPRFWYHLRCFSYVVSLKNYAKAAHHLHLSPSCVTRAIQDLEKDLKVSLLERGGRRRLQLTPQGDQLYAHSLALFGQLIALEDCLYASGEKMAFSLNLAVPEWVLSDYLLSPLIQFKAQYPSFSIQFSTPTPTHRHGDPKPELQIVLGLHSNKGLIQKPLRHWELALYANNSYRQRFGYPRCAEDLKDHLCLAWQISDPTLFKILNWHCLSSPPFVLGSSTALIKMAQMDQGMMTCFRGHPALKDSGLLELGKELCDEQAPRLGLYLVGEPACWAHAEVQALYQHLKQSLQGNQRAMVAT
jgi:DNA-binding transcriptional LysR family regulator